jgi:hypothetical protein
MLQAVLVDFTNGKVKESAVLGNVRDSHWAVLADETQTLLDVLQANYTHDS